MLTKGSLAATDTRAKKNVRTKEAKSEATPGTSRDLIRLPPATGGAYDRFLRLPVAFVLAVMWMAGVVLLGSVALVLYSVGGVLVPLLAGTL